MHAGPMLPFHRTQMRAQWHTRKHARKQTHARRARCTRTHTHKPTHVRSRRRLLETEERDLENTRKLLSRTGLRSVRDFIFHISPSSQFLNAAMPQRTTTTTDRTVDKIERGKPKEAAPTRKQAHAGIAATRNARHTHTHTNRRVRARAIRAT